MSTKASSDKLLFLNRGDLISTFTPERVMKKVKESMEIYMSGKFLMPERLSATYAGQTIVCMPAFTPNACGNKILTVTPSNIERHLPSIYGLMVVNDAVTGRPKGIFDGGAFTAIRTGAIGCGVALNILAPAQAHTLGLIGCGAQGYYHVIYACTVREIDTVYLFNTPKIDLSKFIRGCKEDLKRFGVTREITFTVCESAVSAVRDAEIIVTTTTAPTPVLPDDKTLFEGKTVIGVGSYQPHTRELPDALFGPDTAVFVEIEFAMEEAGELAIPIKNGLVKKEDVHLILEAEKDPSLKKKTNFFKTVGMALYDVVVGDDIFDAAVEKNLGQYIML